MFLSDSAGKVTHFGVWSEDTEERRFIAHALDILCQAAGVCAERDVLTAELKEALSFLERHLLRPALVGHYRVALGVRDPMQRASAVRQAYEAIARAV